MVEGGQLNSSKSYAVTFPNLDGTWQPPEIEVVR